MGHDHAIGQAFGDDHEAMVLAGDLDLAGGQILDRVIGAPMPDLHLPGPGAKGDGEELVAEADAEDRYPGAQQLRYHRHGVSAGRRRIARTVGQEDAVGFMAEDVLGARRRRHHGDGTPQGRQASQDVALGAVIDGDDVTTGVRQGAVALAQGPARLVPTVGLTAGHLLGQIHALEPGPGGGLGLQPGGIEGV